ncbi:MAG: o-succinylbenzoate--CoA ligase [Phototrophicales bacterium]|nr:MAG: o-succinylbenzoate--CoA ligase [Phototrophicales bacterium]
MQNFSQDWLFQQARINPHKTALFVRAKTNTQAITFSELDSAVSALCQQWRATGLQRGDHVGIIATSSLETVIHLFAALRSGVVLVLINARLNVNEMNQQLRNANSQWLAPVGPPENLEHLKNLGHSILSYPKYIPKQMAEAPQIDLDAPLLIVHTSGTSGTPKAAVIRVKNIFYSAIASAFRLGVLPEDIWLCAMPLYHVGGISILLRSCLYGTSVDLHPRFDIEAVNNALCEDKISLISLVPTMLYRLIEQGHPKQWSHLRVILLGGAATPPQLIEKCKTYQLPIALTYGLTEAASQVATTPINFPYQKMGTAGKPLMFTQVRVVNEHDEEVRPMQYGEIIVSGPTVIESYYNADDANAVTFQVDQNGQKWLHTGDIGYFDNDGDLWLVQRRSDLIISGGENIYPAEIEHVLRQHPSIQDVCVVGIPDEEWGQRVAAAIVQRPNNNVSDEELIAFCRQHLAGYKIPRQFLSVNELPMTASGKVQRGHVIKLFEIEQ